MVKGEMGALKKKLAEEERRKQMAEGKTDTIIDIIDWVLSSIHHLPLCIFMCDRKEKKRIILNILIYMILFFLFIRRFGQIPGHLGPIRGRA